MPELPPVTQQDGAYFDYVEGLKLHNYTRHVPRILRSYESAVAARGRRPRTMREAGALIEPDLMYRFASGIQRSSQEMTWAAAGDSLKPHRAAMKRMLYDELPEARYARLELDQAFELPAWYTSPPEGSSDDIHLQPYWGDELVGAIYQRGGGMYRTSWRAGYGKDPGSLLTFARSSPLTSAQRVLDLGCSFGANTIALRLAFPGADEVIGIDLSEDALRWAFLTAEERKLRITFAQRDAARTGYPDGHFDLVAAFLLLHEMPPAIDDQMFREMLRILRPGGHLMFLDIPRYDVLEPEVAFLQSFDQRGNGENFWDPFLVRDLPRVLRDVGFVNVREGPLDHPEPAYWGSAALMRSGEFRPANRWTTHADKAR